MSCPEYFNDDSQDHYLKQAHDILAAGRPDMLTEDHKQALQWEKDNELC